MEPVPLVCGESQLTSVDFDRAVSVSEFLAQSVLPQLSSESRAYSLLREFINVCPDSVNNVSEFCTPVHVDAVSKCCSVDTFLQTRSHQSPLCESRPNTVVNDDLIVPDSQDSYGSVEIPYCGLPGLQSLSGPMNTVVCGIEHTSGEIMQEDKENHQCDKRYYCLFCSKPYAKIKQHLISQHGEEMEVAEMISKSGKDFEKYLLRLRNLGNHKHNCDALYLNSGFLVVAYTPKEGAVSVEKEATMYHVLIVSATMRKNSFGGTVSIAVYGSQKIVKMVKNMW